MNRIIPAFLLVGTSLSGFGQCGMTTIISASPGCFISNFSVHTTGGIPPYSIVIVLGGSSSQYPPINGDADGDYTGNYDAFGVGSLAVTITDANGCTATDQDFTDLWMYPSFAALPSLPDPCTGGGQIRFKLDAPVTGFNSLCPVSTHYLLVNNVSVGPLLNVCVAEGGDYFHTVQAYPPGTYSIRCADLSCNGNMHECWYSATATVSATTSGECDVNINMRGALYGAMQSNGVMTNGLRTANVIPLTEPYTGSGYVFVGSAPGVTMPASVLSINMNDAVVDWVIVELRNGADPTQVVYSKAALIQRDGDVMDPDGTPAVNFPVADGSYYVALRHRNHLGVMTAAPQNLAAAPGWVDFRLSYTVCFGTNARINYGTIWCMWAGDATGNTTIKYTGSGNDRDALLLAVGGTTPNNVVSNVYDRRDTNLDGVIKYTGTANDRDIILTNVGSTTPNNTRTQQLP